MHSFKTGRLRRGAATLSIVALAGCGGSPPAAPGGGSGPAASGGPAKSSGSSAPRLMFITNGTSDWWNAVEKGMRDGAAEFGADVEMRRPDSETGQQIQKIEDVLSLPDVQGVAISVLEADSPGIADKMRELQNAGKVVITIDSDGQKDARKAYIGTDNRKAGDVAGKVAKTLRPKGGKTAVFVGTAAAANARERREGFFAGAGEAFPQIEVFEDRTDHARAQTNVQTAISKYPDVGVFLGLWSYNAHFIAEEVAKFPELRKKATVLTFDLDQLAVDDLAKGSIDATVCQNPYQMGYLARAAVESYIVKDQKTIDEMLPDGSGYDRHRRARDRAEQELAGQG